MIEKLPLRDIKHLIKYIGGSEYGLETAFMFHCGGIDGCGAEYKMGVPLDDDFFIVS